MRRHAKSLVLCVHAHQPVGNFDHVFREAYEKAYKPFFDVVERHPSIPVVCHFSGSLIDWLEKNRPEFLHFIARLETRGQLEVLGGAYYEPIYGVIPERDLLGQIAMMRAKVRALFGTAPKGAWLTERVWDPGLVKPLRRAGVEYTVLDDMHFSKAHVAKPVTGYYQSRDGRETLDLFASTRELRYLMPFRAPEEVIAFIRSVKSKPEDVIVFADDIEKFGMWPGTYHWVYEEGWLEKFLTLLENDPSINVQTFSRARSHSKPRRTVRIPHASYSEMMDWSGGSFGNFFKKYSESRYMRDRMWNVSDTLDKIVAQNGRAEKFARAKEALYRAQCNCTYWHGVFGGLYLHHLRSALFGNLIEAERFIAETKKGSAEGPFRAHKLQSGERWSVRRSDIVGFFNPAYGGALEELDYLPKSLNLMCNLQRHKEFYHDIVLKKSMLFSGATGASSIYAMLGQKDPDLEKYLYYDSARRLSFMDRVFAKEAGREEFSRSRYAEAGDFYSGAYRASLKGDTLRLDRRGTVTLDGRKHPLRITKTAEAVDGGLRVRYCLKNEGRKPLKFTFGTEFNFSIGASDAAKALEERAVREWTFHDSWHGINMHIATSRESSLMTAPVETISESEGGLQRTYQGLAALFQATVSLTGGESTEHHVELSIRP